MEMEQGGGADTFYQTSSSDVSTVGPVSVTSAVSVGEQGSSSWQLVTHLAV